MTIGVRDRLPLGLTMHRIQGKKNITAFLERMVHVHFGHFAFPRRSLFSVRNELYITPDLCGLWQG